MGPFQNKIKKKNIETKKQANPYTKLKELKATNIKNKEPRKIAPRRSSATDKGANFTVSRLSLTNYQEILVDKSFILFFLVKIKRKR